MISLAPCNFLLLQRNWVMKGDLVRQSFPMAGYLAPPRLQKREGKGKKDEYYKNIHDDEAPFCQSQLNLQIWLM